MRARSTSAVRAIYSTRPLLECCKSCTARPKHALTGFIVTFSDLDRHHTVSELAATLAPTDGWYEYCPCRFFATKNLANNTKANSYY